MRRWKNQILLSASDLTAFVACRHLTALDRRHLDAPLPQGDLDALDETVERLGHEHELRYLEQMRRSRRDVVEIDAAATLAERVERTREAMHQGADVIYQGVLLDGRWHGVTDYLVRVRGETALGPYGYEVVDTKLARSAKARHVLQVCLYADLLEAAQGAPSESAHLVLGDGATVAVRPVEFVHYVRSAQRALQAYLDDGVSASAPLPCSHCDLCRWQHLCTQRWQEEDHLSRVANIQRSQIRKLEAAGVRTVRALAALDGEIVVPGLALSIRERLARQARLQIHKRDHGENVHEILPLQDGRGFARLPRPAVGDLFLDLEGDPLYPDGLEYLFGVYWAEGARPTYRAFWAHDHAAERRAFEDLIDFIVDHLRAHPGAHVYHYGHYEETALKRLASSYATQEAALDEMLRAHVLVNLHQVVREAMRVSEPSLSLKDLEVFYQPARAQDVTTAGDSIAVYEQWRQTREDAWLEQIRAYNEQDCRSTCALRDWLLGLRPADLPWRDVRLSEKEERARRERLETDLARQRLEQHLREHDDTVGARLADLVDFHKREARPAWWEFFDRQTKSEEDLIDDAGCLSGLQRVVDVPARREKRSWVFPYRYPPQETKLRAGKGGFLAADGKTRITIESMDRRARTVELKTTASNLPERLSVIPEGPRDDKSLRESIERVARAVLADQAPPALTSLLRRDPPRLRAHPPGAPLIGPGDDLLAATTRAALALLESHLLLQGPPGAGKTYTASHVIVTMLEQGRRVGVSSNSHKAIHNLLEAVERVAGQRGVRFRGLKKASDEDSRFESPSFTNIHSHDDLDPRAFDLIAGTAWLFARENLVGALDTLVVDEAGQVSLANLVAMAPSARNLILVGDQMQLGQPIAGSHPGQAGASALEYLLADTATIAPERGIFLDVTWRMHPDLCSFISEAVYDGRLRPHPDNARQRLLLGDDADSRLRPTGICFLPVEHAGNSQRSDEEAKVVVELYESLRRQRYVDRHGQTRPLTDADILVVAPYNVQVNHLREVLPEPARVGTVDRFQGQEAQVVLISLATSSGEELPRNVEFLYSKNRLNVAISRARCLAVVVASPRLLEVPCSTVEQMRLVDTLCWVRDHALGRRG